MGPQPAPSRLRRTEVGIAPNEPLFSTVDGRFRDPRNVTRNLAEARRRLGVGRVTAHSWRKTMATVLDSSGASARLIADQLGHSRVSMSLDFYLGRRSADHGAGGPSRRPIRPRHHRKR